MKKNTFVKITALLLSAVLATGCSGGKTETIEITENTSSAEDLPVSVNSDNESDSTAKESNPVSGETSDVQKSIDISGFTKPFGDSELRYYESPDGKDYTISGIKSKLALVDIYEGGCIAVDLCTGETAEKESGIISEDDWGRYGTYIVGDYLAETDAYQGTVTIYDKNFKTVEEEKLSDVEWTNFYLAENYILWYKEGNILCYAKIGDDGSITKGEIAVKLPEDMMLSFCCGIINENEFIINYYNYSDYNSHFGVLYMDTGEVVSLRSLNDDYPLVVDKKIVFSEYNSNKAEIFDPEYPSVTKEFEAPVGTSLINTSSDNKSLYFCSDSPSEKEGYHSVSLYRYDISDGKLTASYTTDIEGDYIYIGNAIECEDYVVLNVFIDESAFIIYWKPEEITEPRGYTALSNGNFAVDNVKLAEKIASDYSINIYYGNDAVRHFDSYAVVAENDEKLINNALVTLDGFFGKFPEGFFEELMGNATDYNEINVYLTGRIVPNTNESQSISDAVAFVSTENNTQLMVIDITQGYELEKNTAHEFMHIIENAMYGMNYDEDGNWVGRECFVRWEMLNPKDFDYYFSYTDEYGFTYNYVDSEYNGAMYYDGCGMDINSICFVDGYSMTFPSEDRARIFENIATTAYDALPVYFKGSAMQLKAAYLCACIRESFNCITDDTSLFWENGINPEYTLEYFENNFDIEAYWLENAVG